MLLRHPLIYGDPFDPAASNFVMKY